MHLYHLVENLLSQSCVEKEGSEGYDKLHSAASVVDGVVVSGHFSGTWNGAATSGGYDFAVVKFFSNGTVAWRWQVKEGLIVAWYMAEKLFRGICGV